jgi:hypothetical protein
MHSTFLRAAPQKKNFQGCLNLLGQKCAMTKAMLEALDDIASTLTRSSKQ